MYVSHTAHQALALWALGADEGILKAAYENNSECQLPLVKPAEAITAVNFNDHLGDNRQVLILFLLTTVFEWNNLVFTRRMSNSSLMSCGRMVQEHHWKNIYFPRRPMLPRVAERSRQRC